MNQIKLYDMDTNELRGTLTCNGTRWRGTADVAWLAQCINEGEITDGETLQPVKEYAAVVEALPEFVTNMSLAVVPDKPVSKARETIQRFNEENR